MTACCCAAPCQCDCHREAPPCMWPACLPEAQQQQLADDVTAGMLGEPTGLGPDPRVACGCVDPAGASVSRVWTVTTTVTAPTPADAERWAAGVAQMVRAEFGDSMRLDVAVAPVAPARPPVARAEADEECECGHYFTSHLSAGRLGMKCHLCAVLRVNDPHHAFKAVRGHATAGTICGEPDARHALVADGHPNDVALANWERELLAEAIPHSCPTACEPNCGEICHEDHVPSGQRGHEPDDCPGFNRARHWLFGHWFPNWRGKPLPTMRETAQQMINDLAERGVRLVVPGYDVPPEPTWPYGVQRGDWVTLFEDVQP